MTSIITDAARTEFTEPTTTCICIGPISDEDCIGLTDHLKLYKDDKANQLNHMKSFCAVSNKPRMLMKYTTLFLSMNKRKEKLYEIHSIKFSLSY